MRKKAVQQLNTIEDFNDKLVFDVDNAQKLMLIYLDDQTPITWQRGEYDEWECRDKYGIASYNIDYSMKMDSKKAVEYLTLIKKLEDEKTKIFLGGLGNNDKN